MTWSDDDERPADEEEQTDEHDIDIWVARQFVARRKSAVEAWFGCDFAHDPPMPAMAIGHLMFACAVHHMQYFTSEYEPEHYRDMEALGAYARGEIESQSAVPAKVGQVVATRIQRHWATSGWLPSIFGIACWQAHPPGTQWHETGVANPVTGGWPAIDARHERLWSRITIEFIEDLERASVKAILVVDQEIAAIERKGGWEPGDYPPDPNWDDVLSYDET